ncbi:DUF2073 domain-containing protein [Methanococcoides sp. SA1]|nr:DUF2073 domain-containing protein [Methanococcoides sp. SA1]
MVKKKVVKKKKKVIKRVVKKKVKDLTIHFMPYSEIANEDTVERIKKIMGIVLKGKIIILQGKLGVDEEAKLIENSMMLIGNVKGFAGIEIASLSGENENRTVFEGIRRNIARILVGEQDSITVIGPASVVGEMKKDPKKVELMLARR